MKTVHKLILSLPIAIFILGCSVIEQPNGQEKNSCFIAETRSDLKSNSFDYDVTSEMALYYALSFKRESPVKSIKPYVIDGVTCLYIVNFEKGWMVIPSDSRVQPVLGESESDNLDIETLDNPGVRIWIVDLAETIEKVKAYGVEEYNSEYVHMWNAIRGLSQQERSISKHKRDSSFENVWVKVTTTTTNSVVNANVDHLLSTKWGQRYPWNVTIPVDPNAQNVADTRFPTGCVSTAVSQVLYYYHNNSTYPNDLWHDISVSSMTGSDPYILTLSKSNYTVNSSRWNSMPLISDTFVPPVDSSAIDFTGYRYVSNLMLDVGVRMNASYSMGGTGIPLSFSLHLSPCGISCTAGYFDYSVVKSNLLNGKPVLITAESTSLNESHAWIIDGCYDRTTTTIVTSYYYIYRTGVSYPSNAVYLTESEMLALYPNAFDGMSVIESNTQGNTQYLLMNYGWDGDYDNGHYSIFNYSIDWAYGLNTNKRMFYNLSTGQLN